MATNRKERPNTVQGNRGKGRPKGAKNKISSDVKAMVLAALDQAGGEKYLLQQALDNPGPFMTLLGKILPTQITGKDGGPVQAVTTSVPPEELRQIATGVVDKF